MVMKTYQFFANTGGMNQGASRLALAAGEAEVIENLHLNSEGYWSNQNIGYETLNAASPMGSGTGSGAPVLSMASHHTPAGTRLQVAQCGGSLYQLSLPSGTYSVISSSVALNQPLAYASFLGWLFFCSSEHAPMRWNGLDAPGVLPNWPPTIAGVSVANPSLVTTFANRLVFAGDASNPSMLYISALENATDFTPGAGADAAGALQVSPGDGDSITALQRFYLPLANEEILLIFKRRSIYLLSGHDADTFSLQRVADTTGAVGPKAVVAIGQDVIFLSEHGLNRLTTTALQGSLSLGALSRPLQPIIDSLNPTALAGSHLQYHPERGELWCFLATGSSLNNNRVLVCNLPNTAWSLRTGIEASCSLMVEGALYTGGYAGTVQQQLRGNKYDANPISWRYSSPFYPLGNARVRKRLRDIALYFKYAQAYGVNYTVQWDTWLGQIETATLDLSALLGSDTLYQKALYGQSTYLGNQQPGPAARRIQPPGSGQWLQLHLSGQTPQQVVTLEGWTITVHEGGLN